MRMTSASTSAARLQWFPHTHKTSRTFLSKSAKDHVQTWVNELQILLRRCYITDAFVEERGGKGRLQS